MAATGDRPKDPYRGFRFKVVIGGIQKAGFREVTGLDVSNDTIDYREGSDPTHVRKVPGLVKYANVTLKRGITDDMDIWKWMKQITDGNIQSSRKTGQVILMDDEGKDVAEWDLVGMWPTKLLGPSLNATANEIVIDSLEMTHEGVSRVK